MAVANRNIVVGAARLFLSSNVKTDGTAAADLPTFSGSTSAVTALDNSADWQDVGFTNNGLTYRYEPTYEDVTVDQSLDAALIFKTGMRVTIATEFAEATLENLFVVLNQASGLTGSAPSQTLEFNGGALGEYPVERSLVAVGQAPRPASGVGTPERVYYAYRVLSVDASEHSLARDKSVTFPVSFRLLPVSSTSNAYGRIIDRVYS